MAKKHKNKNKEMQPMLRQKIKIQTSLGEAELTPDATVQVYIDRKNSILKKVKDLQKGDRVLFRNEKISTEFRKVIPLLEENPFYRHAREQIFYRFNSDEDRVTMLRKLLLEGLVNHGYLENTEEMHDKIVMEGTDLTREECWFSRNSLDEILSKTHNKEELPCDSTFQNWINNKSVLTERKYLPLAIQVNPELSEFSEEGNRRYAYEFWKTCRQQVMKGLHKGSGQERESVATSEKSERDYHIVVDDIVNQIVEDYDEKTAIAQVVSSAQTKPNRESDNLSAIILRGGEEPISLEQLWKDYKVISSCLKTALSLYVADKYRIKDGMPIAGEVCGRFFDERDENRKKEEINPIIIEEIKRNILENKITHIPGVFLDLNKGEIRRLFELKQRFLSTLPSDFYELRTKYMLIGKHKNFDETSFDEISGLKRLERKFFEKYKVISRSIVGNLLLTDLYSPGYPFENLEFKIPENENQLQEIREKVLEVERKSKFIKVIRGKEIRDIGERYGFKDIITIDFPNLILNYTLKNLVIIEAEQKSYSHLKPNPKKPSDRRFLRKATKEHNELVSRLIDNPGLIEEGFIPEKAEYRLEDGWARADVFGYDKDSNPMIVEVKQYAKNNGEGFNNAFKAIEQTTGYRAAKQAGIDYCPVLRDRNIKVRGMLVAYEIDNDAKAALEKQGCEYKEIPKDKIENSEAA